jgi:Ca2+-binding EF-hand superfamily protein
MAKEQQVADAFFQVDEDHDGEIDYEQFSSLVEKLGLPNIYPGSIKNVLI